MPDTFPQINAKIQNTMTIEGLKYLGELARSLPDRSTIVEIGPLFGGSTWVLSKNAPKGVKIISIDTWEDAPWIHRRFPGVEFSKETFLENIQDCHNVEAIQGYSPDVVSDYDFENISMVFDDATHGDPGFTRNLNFFIPRLNPHGILCGDDYAAGWPDIIKRVDLLAAKWRSKPEVRGRVWALIKPTLYDPAPPRVFDRLDWSTSGPNVRVDLEFVNGARDVGVPIAWTGALHKFDEIKKVGFYGHGGENELEGEYMIKTTSGGAETWVPFGTESTISEGFLVGFGVRIVGQYSETFSVGYQACTYDLSTGKTGSTKAVYNGRIVNASEHAVITGLRCFVVNKSSSEDDEVVNP